MKRLGACGCAGDVDTDSADKDKQIAKDMDVVKKQLRDEIRLLLLGTGESGKSTIVKQMKVIHNGGFTAEERKSFISAVHANIWDSLATMILALETNSFDQTLSEEGKELASKFLQPFPGQLTQAIGEAATKLWGESAIQAVYARRSEFQIPDCAKYFLDDVPRLVAQGYVPTDQDIIRSRLTTTGIVSTEFLLQGKKFVLVDVGGQRSERKKWIHCFENVTGVIFCVGISEFDQVLYEDNQTNRLQESLKLFHEICTSKWFSQAAVILFLNKEDLFREKIRQGKSISTTFPDFPGPNDYQTSIKYLSHQFTNVIDPLTNQPRLIHSHVTTATDTKNVQVVFAAVQDSLLNQSFAAAGLM